VRPPGDNSGSIRRRAAPDLAAPSGKFPSKKTSEGQREERKKKEEEMKTHVIRSNLTHAAHAAGTTISDRIRRLRVVFVGNGNLEGFDKHTDQ